MSACYYGTMKCGQFDWIVSFEQIRSVIVSNFSNDKAHSHVALVAGCGTSSLSKQLADEWLGTVISVDNDLGCIEHMKLMHPSEERLLWFHYDLVTKEGLHSDYFQDKTNHFDLIVDKGTLDAILVEGSVAAMLAEIRRILSVGGVYIVCSINKVDLLERLLSMNSLGFSTRMIETAFATDLSGMRSGNIAICVKKSDCELGIDVVELEEKAVLNHFFKVSDPLLGQVEEIELVCRLRSLLPSDSTYLNLPVAHAAMFPKSMGLDYSFELFLEDLSGFPRAHEGGLSVEEAVEFVKTMQ